MARSSSDTGQDRTSGKFLTFYLADEEYGVEILKVSEIIGLLPITPVPRTPGYIRGVVNLRGKVIPIMDLRTRFAMAATAVTEQTCIIVVQVDGIRIGLVVDRVSEVMDIRGENVDDTPALGSGQQTEYLLGIAKENGSVKLLLDIDRVLQDADITAAAA